MGNQNCFFDVSLEQPVTFSIILHWLVKVMSRYPITYSIGIVMVCMSIWACKEELVEEPLPENTQVEFQHPDYFPNNIASPSDNPLTEKGVALGRMLFYEKQLSLDGSISCASCHQQSKAFTDGEQFSLGVNGTIGVKNAMSLANLHS